MGLDHQLQRWREAELISAEQVDHIRQFEQRRARPALLYALAAVAGLSIALGLVSIVAANWDLIPGRMKLALDLLAVLGLGQALVGSGRRPPSWVGDALTIAFHGLVLASLALVGQVYQLGGGAWQVLLAWSALTFPLMAQGRSARLALVWVATLQATFAAGLIELSEARPMLDAHALAAAAWAPLATLALGRSAWIRRVRPELASVSRAVGWAELVLGASLSSFAFYDALARGERTAWPAIAVTLLLVLGLSSFTRPTPEGRAERLLIAVTFAAVHLPLFAPHGRWPVAAALTFMSVFAALAVLAHRSGRVRLLQLATALIGARLLVIYFEVFGTLLDTGLVLLLGGLLTLLLTWLWARQRRDFGRELAARKAEERAAP